MKGGSAGRCAGLSGGPGHRGLYGASRSASELKSWRGRPRTGGRDKGRPWRRGEGAGAGACQKVCGLLLFYMQ